MRARRTLRDPAGRRLGIEHELELFEAGVRLDARTVLAGLPLGGRCLDPGDPLARRCPWGGVVTADGREVEIATPPVAVDEDGVVRTVALASAGTRALLEALGATVTARGYSTHLNVEVDDRDATRIGRAVAERMAVAMMLVLDRRDSPGLLVRPRFGRLELGGEYQTGADLRACLVMALGVTVVAERLVRDRRARRAAPPRLAVELVPTPERFGWFVDRRAGGPDLYTHARATRLSTTDGRSITAGAAMAATWAAARDAVSGTVGERDLAAVDRLVDGSDPLPCERDDHELVADPAAAEAQDVVDVLPDRRRRDIRLRTVGATWHAVRLRAERGPSVRWIDVPGERVEPFFRALDAGELDDWLDGAVPVTA